MRFNFLRFLKKKMFRFIDHDFLHWYTLKINLFIKNRENLERGFIMNLQFILLSFSGEERGYQPQGEKYSQSEYRSVAARWTVRFRFVCRDVYSIPPISPAMITGCSCIRPASKTNRSHIYQQFKAAGRDCRCPVGFLRVSEDSLLRPRRLFELAINWQIDRSIAELTRNAARCDIDARAVNASQ